MSIARESTSLAIRCEHSSDSTRGGSRPTRQLPSVTHTSDAGAEHGLPVDDGAAMEQSGGFSGAGSLAPSAIIIPSAIAGALDDAADAAGIDTADGELHTTPAVT